MKTSTTFTASRKKMAWICLFSILIQTFLPIPVMALTGGPSQPEVQSFEPIGTSEMVDVSTGSFVYNIPLLEVGGYPINISYHSGITMDQEASIVGLGWNINPGAINRGLRGLADDFKGDRIDKSFNMKPNITIGVNKGKKAEIFGIDSKNIGLGLSVNKGIFYNNYKGIGLEFGVSPSFTAGTKGASRLTLGLGLSANSQSGISFSPSLNFSTEVERKNKSDLGLDFGIGSTVNSRQGLQTLSLESTKEGSKHGKKNIEASFSFTKPTYTPGAQLPYIDLSNTYSFSVGGAFYGLHLAASFTGYLTTQMLRKKDISSPGYGVMYAQHAMGDKYALHDFNREQDGAFTEHTPNLPLPNFTNDIYSVAGQGVGGSYQLKRHDLGIVSDPFVKSNGGGLSQGLELGAPGLYHAGGDFVVNHNKSHTGAWEDHNDAFSSLQFQQTTLPLEEPAYFKIAGEKSVEEDPILTSNGGTKAVRVKMDRGGKSNMNVKALNNWVDEDGNTLSIEPTRTTREKRNQPIVYMTGEEAINFGLERTIISYQQNQFISPAITPISRNAGIRKGHHISEISVIREDGLRYFYGIPAYNIKQEDISFSVDISSNTPDCQTGLIQFGANDTTKSNKNGIDHYYQKTTTPPYAHSYLLTAVVSQDYVDRTGNGPSTDDFGTYTRFKYSRIHDDYRWRVPYQADSANYNEGFKSDKQDDKANFIKGKKEIWNIHSIESKDQVAEFYYSSRGDSRGAIDGSIITQGLQKLDSIVLYSLPDRRQNTVNAVPLKTVHFRYNESIVASPGLPNHVNGFGKLALTKLWFTYGSSRKGKLSPYKFEYNGNNPPYNLKAYNRWGTYQPNPAISNCNDLVNSPSSTSDYPYVPQNDRAAQDLFASTHHLTEITLPSGGKIKVQYEAHDYAYVQDKRAMEMIPIEGLGLTKILSQGNKLFNGQIPYNFVFFRLRNPIPNNIPPSLANFELKRRYFNGASATDNIENGHLYFKTLLNVGKAGSATYEYVLGYAKIEEVGLAVSSGTQYEYGYIKLKAVSTNDNGALNANPMAKAGWQFTRLNLPKVAYGGPNVDQSGPIKQVLQALASIGKQIKQAFSGFNNHMRNKDYSQEIVLNKSFIRLYSPEKTKIAGGTRVKRISISDEWETLAGTYSDNNGNTQPYNSFEYGQEYDYSLQEIVNGDTLSYSSGVAAYEPMIGGDVNPFRQPIFFNEKVLLAPDNEHYQQAPFGESLFPSPQIIYSRVRVRSILPDYQPGSPNLEKSATGFTEYRYYTAKDFPVKVSTTGVQPEPKRTNPLFKLLKIKHTDNMTATQGFAIELNDMHGKPKEQNVYNQSGNRISGIKYIYQKNAHGLDNQATVIKANGSVSTATIGLESSIITDSREGFSSVNSYGVHLNSDGFLAFLFPVVTVIPLPSYQNQKNRFRSMTTTKVIRRYGLLQKTIAFDLGSTVSTDNLAYDAETGTVLLTRTFNEHKDPIYNLNFPAHWAYEGMQAAYQNIGAKFTSLSFVGGEAIVPPNIFSVGDELSLKFNQLKFKAWVKDVQGIKIYAINKDGSPINGNYETKIIRSGHRNQQNNSIGSITSLKNPVSGSAINFSNKEILNATAIEYDDKWQMWCGWERDTCFEGVSDLGFHVAEFLNALIANQDIGHGSIADTIYLSNYPHLPYTYYANYQAIPYDSSCVPSFNINVYQFGNNVNNLVYFNPQCYPAIECAQSIDIINPIAGYDLTNILSVQSLPNDPPGTVTGYWPNSVIQSISYQVTCLPVSSIDTICETILCPPFEGNIINPFVHNVRGNYRPKKSWALPFQSKSGG